MGSSLKRKASHHWLIERLSAILIVPFSLWFVWGALPAMMQSPSEVRCWFQDTAHMVASVVWTVLLFWHGCLGVQVVLEDYISVHKKRLFALVCCRLLAVVGAFCACIELLLLWSGWI